MCEDSRYQIRIIFLREGIHRVVSVYGTYQCEECLPCVHEKTFKQVVHAFIQNLLERLLLLRTSFKIDQFFEPIMLLGPIIYYCGFGLGRIIRLLEISKLIGIFGSLEFSWFCQLFQQAVLEKIIQTDKMFSRYSTTQLGVSFDWKMQISSTFSPCFKTISRFE